MDGLNEFHQRTRPCDAEVHDIMGKRMMRTSPVLEEAWRYWTSLRIGDRVPMRDALDPRAMALTLGHSMILDRVGPGNARVRLGGRVMNGLMGMDVRGLPVRAFFDVAQRAHAIDLVDRVFHTPATLELNLIAQGPCGPTRARLLILPLRDEAGTVSKALGCIALDRVDPQPPLRFSILRHSLQPFERRNAPRPADTRAAKVYEQAREARLEMAEDAAPYMPEPAGRRPHLRVVK